jgi:SAM-dependent methyltransferase
VSPSDPRSAIEEAMEHIRVDVSRQLGVERPPAADVDPATVVRFSDELPSDLSPEERARLQAEVEELQPWLQGPFLLGGDLVIGGQWRNDTRWQGIEDVVPREMSGMRVLDVGSNAGYDPFMFRRRGAGYVLACEPFGFHRQALFLERIYRSGVDFQQVGWQDLHPELHGLFDFVHCHGVLYHEPHPGLLLERLRAMLAPGGTLLFGSMMLADPLASDHARYVPGSYYGDETWWWVPGRVAMRWMLDTAGFDVQDELPVSPGPPGEFRTVNGYFRCGAKAPALPPLAFLGGDVRVRFPPGHFYSPLVDTRHLGADPERSRVWPESAPETPGVDWRDAEQVAFCRDVLAAQERLDLAPEPTGDPTTFFASNDQFPALDAWLLEGILRNLRPARMIEVGSGFSTLVSARVNREHLDQRLELTCIEPYPRDFVRAGIPGVSGLRVERLEETPLEVFTELEAGDVAFFDTSHVVKTGSDVVHIFGEILPRLRPGVVVHIHDVFMPGDYPAEWVLAGWGWNERYLVQSFLAFNSGFEIVMGAQYMIQRHWDDLVAAMPRLPEHAARGGGSLWLRRR